MMAYLAYHFPLDGHQVETPEVLQVKDLKHLVAGHCGKSFKW